MVTPVEREVYSFTRIFTRRPKGLSPPHVTRGIWTEHGIYLLDLRVTHPPCPLAVLPVRYGMRTLLPLLALFGCTADKSTEDTGADPANDSAADSGSDSGGDSGGDTADTTPIEITNIEAEIAEKVVTVVRVRWTTSAPSFDYVEYGETSTYDKRTPLGEATTDHEVLLLGNPAETDVHFRVVSAHADGGPTWTSEDLSITTGILPAELPELTITGAVTSWNGQYLVLPLQGAAFVIAVIDDQGRYVWYDVLEPGYNLMRAILSHDGTAMLYCMAGPQDNLSIGLVERVSLDGDVRTPIPFPYIDHDFVELPDGTLAGIVVTPESGYTNEADRIVEQAADGTQTDIWNAWEDERLAAWYNPGPHNWTHSNALDYDVATDDYLISSKELGTIVRIDRATRTPIWYLNGRANEFTFTDGSPPGDMQHQFQLIDGGIVVFDNGAQSRGWSRAVELSLDETTKEAAEVWSYRHDPDLGVYAKGTWSATRTATRAWCGRRRGRSRTSRPRATSSGSSTPSWATR